MNHVKTLLAATALVFLSFNTGWAQLLATDDFQSYSGGSDPVGVAGGTGDWAAPWGYNTQADGGVYISSVTKIDGTKSVGLFGSAGSSGRSISRPFPACTNELTVSFSMRADVNAISMNAPTRRMAFTVRAGNAASHFTDQRLSFFFSAGVTNFQWFDGSNRSTNAVLFAVNHVYDVNVAMNPANRGYSFTASNRNNGTRFTYTGTWSVGFDGEAMGSVAFMMRGPSGAGQDAFLDTVSVSAPDYVPPPVPGPAIREGDFWMYFKGTSTPTNQSGNEWTSLAYNDSAWLGPSPSGFGMGDCDDATILSDMQNGYLSVYTRKTFVVTNASSISKLTLGIDYDDGAVVYLNGVEVQRLNMPGGVILHNTPATGNHESSRGNGAAPPNPKEFYALNPALLVNGTNIIAASGHNTSIDSSDLTLVVELYTNASLTRGPFIQMPDAGNKAAIAWNTAALVDSVVDYGLDLTYSAGTISNDTPKREHFIHLSGLLPGTSYYYRVRGNGEILSEGNAFRTRPRADQSFSFAVIGDFGQGTPEMYAIANLINARTNLSALITTGDNVYGLLPCSLDGAPGWYDPYWFKIYEPTMKRVSTFPALGNHDWWTEEGRYMVDYFHLPTNGPVNHLEKNYSFEFGNMHVVVIDTEPYASNRVAAINEINGWVASDLAAATQKWKIAVLHRPPFTTQGSHNDQPLVKAGIVPRLKAAGVQVVFQAHNHWYERINAIDGIQYITTAAAGAGLYNFTARKEYSARLYNSRHSYTVVDVQGGRMFIQQINDLGEVIDEHTIDIDHPFAIDGLIDNPSWSRAANGMNLYSAIRGNYLYVATEDAGEGSDHFIYVADQLTTQRPANWAKSGTIMQWGAFLADENDGAFHGWFGAGGGSVPSDPSRYLSMTSGTNNNAPQSNGVLEGTIDLAGHFGSFPSNLYLAVGAFGTADGGTLAVQVPAGNDNGNIDANEFLSLNPRDIALDLPVANAGSPQQVEAGMWVVLNGQSSFSPAGLPLSYHWEQLTGPTVVTTNLNLALAAFVISSNIPANTDVTFRLRVHDGRFFSDASQVIVTLTPMVDSDGDGLSDNEELTGFDNILTAANPNGNITLPGNPDSDGDGVSDGNEALAGTNPNNAQSLFKILTDNTVAAENVIIHWSAISGRFYQVEYNHLLATTGWQAIARTAATSSVAQATDTNQYPCTQHYYRIGVE